MADGCGPYAKSRSVPRKVHSAEQLAADALSAAQAHHTVVPGQDVAASIVVDLATALLAIETRIAELDARITAAFRDHHQAEIIQSLPGIGPILGAELTAATGDLGGYANSGRLASAAGLGPVPRNSGRRTGNLHRPMRYSPQATPHVLPLCTARDDARGTQ